ncbi:hypothetical protein MBLNU457_g1116t1 [Dothideomycetes sp. NU457]
MPSKPKVLLFDIGGVCVVSPMSAIASYEQTHSLPPGYINHAISSSGPNGAWARLERGEIALDSSFFAAFEADLRSETVWKAQWAKHLQRQSQSASNSKSQNGNGDGGKGKQATPAGQANEESLFNSPPVPPIAAEELYWEMMRVSRHPDPNIYPALRRLRAHSDRTNEFIIAACSNTSIFPADHPFSDPDTPEGTFNKELKSNFEVFVSSAHVGMRKPGRDIYEYTVRELDVLARRKWGDGNGVKAEEVLFLDDIGSNLKAAREVGMRTVKVVMGRTQDAVKQLQEITGLDLGGSKARL